MAKGVGWWPKYLNSPMQVLWWETDEVLPLGVGIFFTVAFRNWIPLIAGAVYTYILIKAKKRFPKGFLYNLMYRVNLHKIDGVPPFLIKEFRE